MHGPLTADGKPHEPLLSESTVSAIGVAIMLGFMLMILIDEGVAGL